MGKYEEALERARAGMPIDEVFPELKESESERIRKALLEYFNDRNSYRDEDETFNGIPFPSIIAYLEKQKEQKLNIELIQKSWYLEGYHDGKYNNEPKWLIQTGKGGPRYEENPKYGTQKPAEWSEEDKVMLNNIIWSVHMKSIMPLDEMDDRSKYKKYEDFLKSLPERFNLQPKQEWSEEDEFFRQQLIVYCENCVQDTLAAKCVDWLKSLRPKPKQKGRLSMKDQWCCNAAWAAVRDCDAYTEEEKQVILDFLQICNTQSHWKPSEEQIKKLFCAIDCFEEKGMDSSVLYSLLDDLKSL